MFTLKYNKVGEYKSLHDNIKQTKMFEFAQSTGSASLTIVYFMTLKYSLF